MYSQASAFWCRYSQLPLPDVLPALCCLMNSWPSAAWFIPSSLLPDGIPALCCLMNSWPSAAWCTPGPLLPDVIPALCCLMNFWPSGAWFTPGPLISDVLPALCCLLPGVHQAAEGQEFIRQQRARSTSGSGSWEYLHQKAEAWEYIRQWKPGVPTSESRSLGVHQEADVYCRSYCLAFIVIYLHKNVKKTTNFFKKNLR